MKIWNPINLLYITEYWRLIYFHFDTYHIKCLRRFVWNTVLGDIKEVWASYTMYIFAGIFNSTMEGKWTKEKSKPHKVVEDINSRKSISWYTRFWKRMVFKRTLLGSFLEHQWFYFLFYLALVLWKKCYYHMQNYVFYVFMWKCGVLKCVGGGVCVGVFGVFMVNVWGVCVCVCSFEESNHFNVRKKSHFYSKGKNS